LAAAVVLMAWLARPLLDRTSAPLAGQRVEDLNRDGRIDILDAFALARQVEHGEKPGRQLDLNGDGMIDRRDAELIAAHAVSLEKGNHL
jgi:hypothetical protein